MACPVHIWVPLMGAAVPVARAARTRLRLALDTRRAARSPEPPREVKRWAPVGAPPSEQSGHGS